MSTLKIELTLDGTNEELTALTGALMSALAGKPLDTKISAENEVSGIAEVKKEEEIKKEAPKRTRSPNKSKVKKDEAPIEEPEDPEELEEPEEGEEKSDDKGPATSEVNLDQIRELMAKKIGEHRDAVKKKMTSMGAANLSSIPEEKFDTFYEFLNKLS